jgi:hypothetical protein
MAQQQAAGAQKQQGDMQTAQQQNQLAIQREQQLSQIRKDESDHTTQNAIQLEQVKSNLKNSNQMSLAGAKAEEKKELLILEKQIQD